MFLRPRRTRFFRSVVGYSSAITPQHWAFLWLGLLVIYLLSGTTLVPFHGDEATIIYTSHDYATLFLRGDLAALRYQPPPKSSTAQHLRLLNGTLARYLIGFSWHLAGFAENQLNEQWDWGADWTYNQNNGHAPSTALLQVSRLQAAILLAGGVIVIFLIAWQAGGLRAAYCASLLYTLNPALLLNGRRAMMEGGLIGLSLLVVVGGIWFLQRPSWRSTLLLGLAAGLALAAKHTAVFTLAAVFGGCAVYIGVRVIRTIRVFPLHITLRFSAALLLAAVVFLALNPAWWDDPFGRARTVLDLRQELLAEQTQFFGGYPNFAAQVNGFVRQVITPVAPQFYEAPAWADWLAEALAHYQNSVWDGYSLGSSAGGTLVLLLALGAGAWALVRGRKTRQAARWLVVVWAVAMISSTLLLTPVEWQRYYLPAQPVVALLAGLGLARLWSLVGWLWRKRGS